MNTQLQAQDGIDTFAKRLNSARCASGAMAVEGIAHESGIPASDIHDYESGSKVPTLSVTKRLADALDIPSVFLTRPLCKVDVVSNRKHFQLGNRRFRRILIDIQVAFENYYNIEDVLEVQLPDFATEHQISSMPLTTDEVERIAREMRSTLRISPEECQPAVHATLDSSVRLLPFSGPSVPPDRLDGCVVKSDRGDKAIAFNTCAPVDRQRFTLARELAHLIMASELNEAVADRFAAAFLMPAELFIEEFKRLNGQEIELAPMGAWQNLKRKFGCSIAALIMRCHELGLIDEHSYTRNMIWLSFLGWRKHEPDGGLVVPHYRRYADLCFEGWRRGLITRSKLSELLGGELEVDEIPSSR